MLNKLKIIFFFALFEFFDFNLFSQSWLDSFNNVKNKFPDSVREKVDEAFSNENIKKSVSSTENAFNIAFEDISPEEEYYIGREIAARILAKYNVYESDEAQKYLNMILHSLTVFSERPILFKDYSVVILDSDEINAFATAGGHIMVTLGLIKCSSSEDSLAAILAHEVGHVLLKHSSKAIKKSRLGGAAAKASGTALLFADSINEKKVDENSLKDANALSTNIDSAINEMIETGYSQQQELSADTKSLELLDGAGYNPRAMDIILKALLEKSSKNDKSGFGKNHPSPSARLKNVSIRYKYYPDSSTYKVSKERENRFEAFFKSLK